MCRWKGRVLLQLSAVGVFFCSVPRRTRGYARRTTQPPSYLAFTSNGRRRSSRSGSGPVVSLSSASQTPRCRLSGPRVLGPVVEYCISNTFKYSSTDTAKVKDENRSDNDAGGPEIALQALLTCLICRRINSCSEHPRCKALPCWGSLRP